MPRLCDHLLLSQNLKIFLPNLLSILIMQLQVLLLLKIEIHTAMTVPQYSNLHKIPTENTKWHLYYEKISHFIN